MGKSPEGVSVSADGNWVAAASEEEQRRGAGRCRGAARRWPLIRTEGKNPEHAVFSPDSRWLYVSAEEATQVDIIDVAARAPGRIAWRSGAGRAGSSFQSRRPARVRGLRTRWRGRT
jgi:hypothetical protein